MRRFLTAWPLLLLVGCGDTAQLEEKRSACCA